MRNPAPFVACCAVVAVRIAPMNADHGRISPSLDTVCIRSGS